MLPLLQAAEAPVEAEAGTGSEELEERSFEAEETQENAEELEVGNPRASGPVANDAMWGPPVISWFINPINYSYKYNNHMYWSYKPT